MLEPRAVLPDQLAERDRVLELDLEGGAAIRAEVLSSRRARQAVIALLQQLDDLGAVQLELLATWMVRSTTREARSSSSRRPRVLANSSRPARAERTPLVREAHFVASATGAIAMS